MPFDPSLFRAYDIRGIYPSVITEDFAYVTAQAFVKVMDAKTVIVGSANTPVTPKTERVGPTPRMRTVFGALPLITMPAIRVPSPTVTFMLEETMTPVWFPTRALPPEAANSLAESGVCDLIVVLDESPVGGNGAGGRFASNRKQLVPIGD